MKKLSQRQKQWFLLRARDEARRKHRAGAGATHSQSQRAPQYHGTPVQIWQGGEPEQAICVRKPSNPPEALCFDTNPAQTTEFFAKLRMLVQYLRGTGKQFVTRKNPESVPRIHGYIDFSKLFHVSLPAAVVMAADYDRLHKICGEVPPAIDLHTWDRQVLTTLFQLGFFETVGHLAELRNRLVQDGSRLTMRIVAAEDASKLEEIDLSLQDLATFLAGNNASAEPHLDDAVVALLTTLSEAITNVTQHAYPEDHDYEFEHISRLWVSATADKDKNTLTVVVYDQGVTIPVTYPRLTRKQQVVRFLRRALANGKEFDYSSDGTYIRAAMRYGGSRTDKAYRGKGFPQMIALLKSVGGGRLSIWSRNGWCTANTDGRLRSGYVDDSIGGTLVELTVNLGAYLDGMKDDD